jgi:hypothetical protein
MNIFKEKGKMHSFRQKTSVLAIVLSLCLGFPALGNLAQARPEKNLTLGCLAYSEPILQWIKEGLDPLGYKVIWL